MGYIAGLVPGTKAASTCQVNAQGSRSPHPRCGSGPIISITSEEDRRLSLGLHRKEYSEPRVNFNLPPSKYAQTISLWWIISSNTYIVSFQIQRVRGINESQWNICKSIVTYVFRTALLLEASTSQTSSREKIRGSPRFPHRIVPTNSLNTIAPGSSISRSHRWHSMEDARKTKVSQLPRGSSCSPSCDVWATREFGIPLSELGNTVRGKKTSESLTLTIMAESNVNSDDAKLGNNLKKLFEENDMQSNVSPADSELKITRSISSSSSSPTNTRTSSAIYGMSSSRKESSSESAQLDTSTNFIQKSECSRPSSPTTRATNLNIPAEMDSHINASYENGKSTAS